MGIVFLGFKSLPGHVRFAEDETMEQETHVCFRFLLRQPSVFPVAQSKSIRSYDIPSGHMCIISNVPIRDHIDASAEHVQRLTHLNKQ